jgi:hypothetical protein
LQVPGDSDDDGFVGGSDFLIWQRGFGSPYDGDDFFDWHANYTLKPRVQSVSAVPEPHAWELFAALAIAAALISAPWRPYPLRSRPHRVAILSH